MKTIAQLLELSKNPFYKFTPLEREVLDDFLLQRLDIVSPKSQKKSLKKSSKKTRAIVRNIVKRVDTGPMEAHESSSDAS